MGIKSCLTCALVVGLMAGVSSVQAVPPGLQPAPTQAPQAMPRVPPMPIYKLTCVVRGTPVEFPDDIAIINNGPGTVPAGTKVHWSMTAPAKQGDYTFTAPLAPNRLVTISGVLPGGMPAGMPCQVQVVK